ncbi:MAG TPA: hypothetical protein VMZ66_04510 [Aeromicrobium sp.]|nr:hypothetical protein [Aeromicrobium sp.]
MSIAEPPRFEPAVTATTANGWSNLGSNGSGNGALNSHVYAATIYGGDLYVGGNFYQGLPNSTSLDFLAKWNGSAWSSVGSNGSGGPAIGGRVYALHVSGGNLLVGGDFTNAGGDPQADELAVWNGTTFSDIANIANGTTVSDPFNFGEIHAIASNQSSLFFGGYWYNSPVLGGSSGNPGDMVLSYDGTWHSMGASNTGDGPIQCQVDALVATETHVYAGGCFTNVYSDGTIEFAARFDIDNFVWEAMDNAGPGIHSIGGTVHALAMSGTDLYVGGEFLNADNIADADYLAKWNTATSSWSDVGGTLPNGFVRSIAVSGTNVYVGGDFIQSPGPMDHVAKWNGSTWSALGSNGSNDGALFGKVNALALTSTSLYAGGEFQNAGVIPEADYIASYGLSTGKQKPDGRIRKGSGTLGGNNIYNTTGLNQTRSGSTTVGNTITFTISIQNDGTGAGRFGVAATSSGNVNFQVKYFRGTTEITSAVVAGTYTTGSVGVGNSIAITAKVKVVPAVIVGSPTTRLITITSLADASKIDAVKFTATRT